MRFGDHWLGEAVVDLGSLHSGMKEVSGWYHVRDKVGTALAQMKVFIKLLGKEKAVEEEEAVEEKQEEEETEERQQQTVKEEEVVAEDEAVLEEGGFEMLGKVLEGLKVAESRLTRAFLQGGEAEQLGGSGKVEKQEHEEASFLMEAPEAIGQGQPIEIDKEEEQQEQEMEEETYGGGEREGTGALDASVADEDVLHVSINMDLLDQAEDATELYTTTQFIGPSETHDAEEGMEVEREQEEWGGGPSHEELQEEEMVKEMGVSSEFDIARGDMDYVEPRLGIEESWGEEIFIRTVQYEDIAVQTEEEEEQANTEERLAIEVLIEEEGEVEDTESHGDDDKTLTFSISSSEDSFERPEEALEGVDLQSEEEGRGSEASDVQEKEDDEEEQREAEEEKDEGEEKTKEKDMSSDEEDRKEFIVEIEFSDEEAPQETAEGKDQAVEGPSPGLDRESNERVEEEPLGRFSEDESTEEKEESREAIHVKNEEALPSPRPEPSRSSMSSFTSTDTEDTGLSKEVTMEGIPPKSPLPQRGSAASADVFRERINELRSLSLEGSGGAAARRTAGSRRRFADSETERIAKIMMGKLSHYSTD